VIDLCLLPVEYTTVVILNYSTVNHFCIQGVSLLYARILALRPLPVGNIVYSGPDFNKLRSYGYLMLKMINTRGIKLAARLHIRKLYVYYKNM
jgi:hypothetical protein